MSWFKIGNKELGAGVENKGQELFQQNTKAKKFFSREGFGSVMDRNLIKKNVDDYKNALGEGSYNIKLCDRAGNELAGQPINLGGRIMYPNDQNMYTIVDPAYLQEQRRVTDERIEYIDSVIEYATASDLAFATVCNISVENMRKLFEKGGLTGNDPTQRLNPNRTIIGDTSDFPQDLDVNCQMHILQLLPQDTPALAAAVAKCRYIIEKFSPHIEGMGTKKAINENT